MVQQAKPAHNFKLEFLEDFTHWVKEIRREKAQVIVAGDFNIARSPLDIPQHLANAGRPVFAPTNDNGSNSGLKTALSIHFETRIQMGETLPGGLPTIQQEPAEAAGALTTN